MANLSLTAPADASAEHLGCFSALLQEGFTVRVRVGCTIEELLCFQLGLDPVYLKQRITTIFLNGKAIDAPEKSQVADGATLALSAAMPGLVGATMRRGGYYAAMRGAMTFRDSASGAEEKYGRIRIKLFNLLMAELGPGFLRRGIILSSGVLADFLVSQSIGFWERWSEIRLDGKAVAPTFLPMAAWTAQGEESIELSVLFEE